jgi:hypothetical protein
MMSERLFLKKLKLAILTSQGQILTERMDAKKVKKISFSPRQVIFSGRKADFSAEKVLF